jgi:hypothetical protein
LVITSDSVKDRPIVTCTHCKTALDARIPSDEAPRIEDNQKEVPTEVWDGQEDYEACTATCPKVDHKAWEHYGYHPMSHIGESLPRLMCMCQTLIMGGTATQQRFWFVAAPHRYKTTPQYRYRSNFRGKSYQLNPVAHGGHKVSH